MAVSPGEGNSIVVRGNPPVSRRSGRIQKPTAKVRVIQHDNSQEEVAGLKYEIRELSKLIQDLLQRDAEREQLLRNCSQKIETLEKELQQEKQRSALQQNGLGRSMHAGGTGRSNSETTFQAQSSNTGKPTYAQTVASADDSAPKAVNESAKKPEKTTETTVVVVPQTPVPSIQSKEIRDGLNSALKAPVVIGVNLSAKGNIVLRLKNFTADDFLSRKATWQHIFDKLPVKDVTKPEQWLKLVAYVPVKVADGFVEDLKAFHGVNVMGTSFWLEKPIEGVHSAPL